MNGIVLVLALVTAASSAAFVPPPPGELRGQVTTADGGPVQRFTVNGVAFDDAEGRFRILTPPEGEFRVVVRADGFAPNVFHVQGASGKKLVVPEIRLGSGEHVLGEVVDATTGDPVPLARATLADPAKLERLRFIRPERVAGLGVTGSGGYFELRRAPRGLLVLVVQHPDYLPEFVPVNTRSPLPAIRLHRGGNLTGTVRDERGAPLPGVRVLAISEEAGDGAETSADVHGRFEMARLRPGSYRMIAVAQGKAVEGGRVQIADGVVAQAAISVKGKAKPVQLPTIELGLGALPSEAIASR
jgi:hypothetical protein